MAETFRASLSEGDLGSISDLALPSPQSLRGRHAVNPLTVPLPVAEAPGVESVGLPRWQRRYVLTLLGLDTIAVLLGGLIGQLARFETLGGDYNGIAYRDILLAAAPVWILTLAAARTYETRFLGLGSEEFRRVANAAARFTALVAMIVYIFKWDIARGLVIVALPTAAVLTLALRYGARKVLHRLRRNGGASHRVLVVGEQRSREVLTRRLTASTHSGLRVVGACEPVQPGRGGTPSVEHVRSMVHAVQADTVAVTHSAHLEPDLLRQLAWSLEGTGINLIVAPALTDIAGPRVSIRPVSGLPLLQIAEPEFTGVRRILKRAMDLACTGLALLVGSPLFAAVALAIALTSRGPVLFRQVRIGKDGQRFVIYKFRSMYTGAESRQAELLAFNDHGTGVLFKMRDDPRITPVGRYLRRFSLDELPQLVNVLIGQMSMVGPRPPLPEEVARYELDTHRRLLVKPGLTGLWQVSGRSDLDWEETVRLDLYYVENWSVALDLEIIWKTVGAVLRGSGAR